MAVGYRRKVIILFLSSLVRGGTKMVLYVAVLGRKIRLNQILFNLLKANRILLKVLDAITYRKVIILELET